jgi:hypothetical protein
MSEFIFLTGASGAPALIRVSAIIAVTQDREDTDLRAIEYTAGGKVLRLFVQDTTEEILKRIKWEAAGE